MIPKSFQILGNTIKVKITEDVDDHSVGNYSGDTHQISILPVGKKMSSDNQAVTFWHEVVHCIFQTMSYDEYDKDEALVDRIAQCLYQIDKTKK